MSKAHRAPLDSADIGLVWGYVRDYDKPKTKREAETFDEARSHFGAPSKAHIQRLRRVRLEIVPSTKHETAPSPARLAHNALLETQREVLALARRREYGHR